MPYAYAWIPGLVFVIVVGTIYWLSRPAEQLVQPLTNDGPGGLSISTPKAKDLRGTFRRQGNTVEVFITTPEDKDNPDIGSVLDRSMGGVRLGLFHEVPVGAIFSIRPTHADDIVPWVEIEIRSCRASEELPDQFEVGCQYVKSPPYSIQLLFG